jgi:hypothetical protein
MITPPMAGVLDLAQSEPIKVAEPSLIIVSPGMQRQ